MRVKVKVIQAVWETSYHLVEVPPEYDNDDDKAKEWAEANVSDGVLGGVPEVGDTVANVDTETEVVAIYREVSNRKTFLTDDHCANIGA